MKKLNLWLMSLVVLAAALTVCSCENEDDNNVNNGTTLDVKLEAPAMQESAMKCLLDENSQGIESIELTESGNYIIEYNGYANPAYPEKVAKKGMKGAMHRAVRRLTTRYGYGNIEVGTYKKLADEKYLLDNGVEIILNITEKVLKIDGNACKYKLAEQMVGSSDTNNLCRTWYPVRYRIYIKLNGKTIYDKTNTSEAELRKDFDKYLGGDYQEDDEYYKEDEVDYVIFSRSGTYFVQYIYDPYNPLINLWEWSDKRGVMHWIDPDPEWPEDGYVNVAYDKDKHLVITEGISFDDDDEEGSPIGSFMNMEVALVTVLADHR